MSAPQQSPEHGKSDERDPRKLPKLSLVRPPLRRDHDSLRLRPIMMKKPPSRDPVNTIFACASARSTGVPALAGARASRLRRMDPTHSCSARCARSRIPCRRTRRGLRPWCVTTREDARIDRRTRRSSCRGSWASSGGRGRSTGSGHPSAERCDASSPAPSDRSGCRDRSRSGRRAGGDARSSETHRRDRCV